MRISQEQCPAQKERCTYLLDSRDADLDGLFRALESLFMFGFSNPVERDASFAAAYESKYGSLVAKQLVETYENDAGRVVLEYFEDFKGVGVPDLTDLVFIKLTPKHGDDSLSSKLDRIVRSCTRS